MLALSTNLANYDHKRMVIMAPGTPVYEAVRALEANHIGCIVVAESERVFGIVTDRDLALRVIGYDLDAHELSLGDVMTRDVATVPATATEADAADVMLARHVRRVPIEDHGRIVGIVTLDDLVIHGFDPTTVARIIASQLTEPARHKERGDVHPMAPTHEKPGVPSAAERADRRHRAHAQSTYDALLRRVMSETGLDTRERTEAALDALLAGIVERITPDEAAELLSQLPSTLRDHLRGVPTGPDRSVTRESIERVLSVRLGIGEARASQLMMRLGHALQAVISLGELRDMKAQLPDDLRAIFS